MRSESLHRLGTSGWLVLRRHGVRTAVDLRSSFESSDASYEHEAAAAGVTVAPTLWEEGLLDDPEFRNWAETGLLSCALYYRRFLERWPHRAAATVRAVANAAPGGVLIHCVRGRDRTGLLTTLLLTLVGVPADAVVADYLLTDDRLVATGIALGHEGLDGEAELYAAAGTTAEATLHDLLATLDLDALLRHAGLRAAELDRLRDRPVEPR